MNEKVENAIANIVATYRRCRRGKFQAGNVKKILVLRTDHLGDMVCTVPFIRELRRAYGGAEITLLCSPEVYNLVEIMPYADRVVKLAVPKFHKHVFEQTIAFYYRYVREHFSQEEYDIVFTPVCPTQPITRILAYFINSRKVLSYYIQNGKVRMTDTAWEGDLLPARHMVEICLDMLAGIGKNWQNDELELWRDANDIRIAKNLLAGLNNAHMKVVMFLSTSAAYKDWDLRNYAEVAKALEEKYNAQIILLGAKSDTEEKGEQFMQLMPTAHNFIGMTSIRQTYEIICQSDLYVGGDTGTMHLAAASKIPGVAIVKDYEGAIGGIMGALMDRCYPWKSTIKIIQPEKPLPGCEIECRKNFAHCINQITPEVVLQELANIIENDVANGRLRRYLDKH